MPADYKIRANTVKFNVDVDKFAKNIGVPIRKARKKIAMDLFAAIQDKPHPIDTGRALAGWQMTDSSPSTSAPPKGEYSRNPVSGLSQPAAFALDFDVTWIANNVPYINKLEFDGHSQQAVNGWVRAAVAAVETRVLGTLS